MRKLTESELFKELSKKTKLGSALSSIDLQRDVLSLEAIDDNMRLINRRFNYQLKNKVIKDLEEGIILPIYPEVEGLTKLTPIITIKQGAKVKALVNLKLYGNLDKEGYLNIDNRTLFTLLQSGSISVQCIENWNKIKFNTRIIEKSTEIYVKMVNKVLDKMFALNLNQIKTDKINYVVAKFFLSYVMEKEDGLVNNLAYKMAFNKTREEIVTSIEDDLDVKKLYGSLHGFFEELATVEGLEKLTLRSFLNNWMTMYGESTILSLEYYPSLLENVFAAMMSAYINKTYMFESLVAEETLDLYNELSRILK